MQDRAVRQTSAFSGTFSRGAALLSRHLPAVPEAMAGRVRFEQLVSIQRLTPVMMGANIINAQLVFLAGLGGAHRLTLMVWAGVVTAYALLGFHGWLSARRRKSGKNTVSARGARRVAMLGPGLQRR